MKKIKIDFDLYPTKQMLFSFLKQHIDGLFGENYDALIDALTFYKTPLVFLLKHISSYEEKENLIETLKIIHKENSLITYINKA